MKKGLLILLVVLAMALMMTVSVSAEEEAMPIEEWQLVSSSYGTMTASIYEDLENGGFRLEIVSVPKRETNPITMPSGVSSAWSAYKESITSVYVSEGTINIPNSAFADHIALKSVELNEGLVRIEANAFSGCTSLTEVRLPNTVTTILGNIFRNCTSLTSVELSEKMTGIGVYMFAGCTALESVTIPSGIRKIENYAFESCASLTSIVIPEGVTQVGQAVFQNCIALTEITLPSSLTTVGSGMFRYCERLVEVVIPDTVEVISPYAFADCMSLSSITIGSGVETIGASAFAGCQMLTNIYIPLNVTRVDSYAFRNCRNAVFYVAASEEEVFANWNSAWNPERCTVFYGVLDGHIHSYESSVIKEPTHFEEGLAELYCAECGDIRTEAISKIPHSYKSETTKEATHFETGIRTYRCDCGYSYDVTLSIIAHSYVSETTKEPTHTEAGVLTYTCSCGNYYTEEIPAMSSMHEYVETSRVEADHYTNGYVRYACVCGSSYTVTIEKQEHEFVDGVCSCGMVKGVDPIEIWDISYNTRELVTAYLYHDLETDGLYRLVISGNGRARYYNLPWRDYKNQISEVVFEDGVKYEVPGRAFEGYSELRRVIIGKGIEVIRNGAFRLCEKLVFVEVTGSLMRIENSAFERCIALEEIIGIAQLDYLGGYAFANCTSLKSFQAEFIVEVGARAFLQCTSLEVFDVIGGVVCLRDGAFERCTKLREVNSLEKLQYLGRYVFRDCLEIRKFVLDANLIELVPQMFSGCRGLEVIVIRGDVKEIPSGAFSYCSSLRTIYIESSTPVTINEYAFLNCNNLQNVIINGDVSYVGTRAFVGCRMLERVYFDSETPVIVGERAFEGCSNLVSAISSSGFANIGKYAFASCQRLEKIKLSDYTKIIEERAFYNCRALKEVCISGYIEYIGPLAFFNCSSLTIYTNVDIGMFGDCNPQNRPVENYELAPEELYCEHMEAKHWIELERTHFNIGLEIYRCACGKVWGEIAETTPDHDFSQFASDGVATHTRKCFCGYVETVKHTFTGNICTECGLQKNVIVYDDIENITASGGFENFGILFDGLKATTGLKAESDIEYYPTKDKDYIYITLKEEVDLAGITAWICGNKGHIKITVFGSDGKKTGEGKIELKGSGDYYDYKSVPVNVTFFGTAAVKYVKIEAEGLAKESGLVQKISELDLTLGTKLDLETGKPHTNIELVFDIPTLNAIGIEITPEILEKLSRADVKVESDIGQIILDAISMGKVSGVGGNVTIGITDITDEKEVNKGKRVFSITVNDENGNPILPPDSSDENGTLTLSFKYKAGLKKEQIKVVYRDEDGKIQHMEVESYDPVTGIVQFKTNHLSVYEIYADGESNEGLLEGAFEFKGYSVSTQTGALAIGFSVNYDVIRDYEAIMETTVDFGVVFASFEDLGGKNPFDENGNLVELENTSIISMPLTEYEYTDYTFVIGEMTEEYFDHSFTLSAYAKGMDGMWYYQDKGMCDTVDGITYNEILEFEILE